MQELTDLSDEHSGDLPVTVVISGHEFTLRNVCHVSDGPLPNIANIQKQNPPERLVFEVKDDILNTM